jgi:hypothetical protein
MVWQKSRLLLRKERSNFYLTKKLETDIFESQEVLERLCLMTGGHVRNLILLMQTALDYVDALPITCKSCSKSNNSS